MRDLNKAGEVKADLSTQWLVPTMAAAAAKSASPSAPSAARGLLFRLVDRQGSATNLSSVQRQDGGFGITLASHLDKGKPSRSPRVPIGNDLHIGDLASAFFEERAELRCVRVKRKVAHIHSRPHDLNTPLVGLRPTPDGQFD